MGRHALFMVQNEDWGSTMFNNCAINDDHISRLSPHTIELNICIVVVSPVEPYIRRITSLFVNLKFCAGVGFWQGSRLRVFASIICRVSDGPIKILHTWSDTMAITMKMKQKFIRARKKYAIIFILNSVPLRKIMRSHRKYTSQRFRSFTLHTYCRVRRKKRPIVLVRWNEENILLGTE